MAECGIATAAHFHEVATGGQCEIDLMPQPLVESADQVMLAKYIIRNVARRSGKTATFMPKPLFGDNGSGMHTHLTLWKDDEPLLAGHGYAGLSDLGMYAIGGLLKHAPALCAFANPTTNSYKRLVEGFEAPTKFSYSRRNRAAIIRIPVNSPSPRSRRIEYRCPDSAANPVPALLRDADGRPRRHPEQDPARRPARQGHLRPPARGAGDGPDHARARSKPRSTPSAPTTTSCSAAMSSRPTSSTPGSGTSRTTRSRPSAFAPTRTNSRFTMMCDRSVAVTSPKQLVSENCIDRLCLMNDHSL